VNYYFIFGKMSKIGQKPVSIPTGVQVTINTLSVVVTGPKGTLTVAYPHFITVAQEGAELMVTRKTDAKRQKASHGLYRSIIANAVKGVTEGWSKRLEVVGTGYNGKIQGRDLNMKLGFSHPAIFKCPEGIQFAMEGNTIIIVSGIDKQKVGEVAQQIKILRKPDPYKGKGIRDEGQIIKLKPGKKAKTA